MIGPSHKESPVDCGSPAVAGATRESAGQRGKRLRVTRNQQMGAGCLTPGSLTHTMRPLTRRQERENSLRSVPLRGSSACCLLA